MIFTEFMMTIKKIVKSPGEGSERKPGAGGLLVMIVSVLAMILLNSEPSFAQMRGRAVQRGPQNFRSAPVPGPRGPVMREPVPGVRGPVMREPVPGVRPGGPRLGGGRYPYGSPDGGLYGQPRMVPSQRDAKRILNGYFSQRNAAVGSIQDRRFYYEADIRDARGNLVDRVIIDKRTGRIRSMY